MALAAGVYACFGRHHDEYDRILAFQDQLLIEWREIIAERNKKTEQKIFA